MAPPAKPRPPPPPIPEPYESLPTPMPSRAPREVQGDETNPAGVRRPTASGPAGRQHLGEMLLKAGLINEAKLQQALSMAKRNNERLGDVLVKAGFARVEDIARSLAKQFRIEFLEPKALSVARVDRSAVRQVGIDLLQGTGVVPVVIDGRPLLALSDPLDIGATDKVEALLGKREYVLTTAAAIEMALQVVAFESVDAEKIIESARDSIEQGELKVLVQYILGKAVLEKCSDVHIEPSGNTSVVRFRVDGDLKVALSVPRSRHENLTNLFYAMAGVDLSDFGRLQDGRFTFNFAGRSLDVRFASSPTVEGPMMVMRILDDTRSLATLEDLGYAQWNLDAIGQLMRYPFGLVLVVGPTGSGKTTTLYSCLSRVNDGATKILTVEDPVEIRLPSIQQVQVNEKAEVTFARTVRAFLRQDPDVILVGEIRDEETAREAFRAANTGHLVFSTLHANSAVEAIGRLIDLGMDSYQISTTLLGAISQRLMRKACPHCSVRASLSPKSMLSPEAVLGAAAVAAAKPVTILTKGKGCSKCVGGSVGRTVVAEVLVLENQLRELVHQRASNEQIVRAARQQGFRSMADNALWLVVNGEASLQEAEATVGPITTGKSSQVAQPKGKEASP